MVSSKLLSAFIIILSQRYDWTRERIKDFNSAIIQDLFYNNKGTDMGEFNKSVSWSSGSTLCSSGHVESHKSHLWALATDVKQFFLLLRFGPTCGVVKAEQGAVD